MFNPMIDPGTRLSRRQEHRKCALKAPGLLVLQFRLEAGPYWSFIGQTDASSYYEELDA